MIITFLQRSHYVFSLFRGLCVAPQGGWGGGGGVISTPTSELRQPRPPEITPPSDEVRIRTDSLTLRVCSERPICIAPPLVMETLEKLAFKLRRPDGR